MVSISLFPSLFTGGAGIIGQLIHSLHLKVYTDEMLLADIAEQFGISKEKLSRLYAKEHTCNHLASLMEITCAAKRKTNPGRYLFYGLHTAILHSEADKVLKIFITDTDERRVKRAMINENIGEKVARSTMTKHDEKSLRWIKFLFHKAPSDPSLYDRIIHIGHKGTVEIANQIITLHHLRNGRKKESAHQLQFPPYQDVIPASHYRCK